MEKNGVKKGRIYIKLYMSIFIRQKFCHPPKVFLSETLYVESPKNLVICFKATLASLLLDTTKTPHSCLLLLSSEQRSLEAAWSHPRPSVGAQSHPPGGIYSRPGPGMAAWGRLRSGGVYLGLVEVGLEPFMFILGRPQPFAGYLRPALIFVGNSALRREFNFCFS